ncbi:DUF397 domain-containing protein [Spirillospora sp. NPDC029432]|uniref:DUF397 domain-containing protein n=1 Tax=Spirillospora sp. NPDC029432 TaxID=3154599 RepID=UPI003452D9EC
MKDLNGAAAWRKSSHSGQEGGPCVELADLGGSIGVRDSKAPEAGNLVLKPEAMAGLVARIKAGRLDL